MRGNWFLMKWFKNSIQYAYTYFVISTFRFASRVHILLQINSKASFILARGIFWKMRKRNDWWKGIEKWAGRSNEYRPHRSNIYDINVNFTTWILINKLWNTLKKLSNSDECLLTIHEYYSTAMAHREWMVYLNIHFILIRFICSCLSVLQLLWPLLLFVNSDLL